MNPWHLLTGRAYEGDKTRTPAILLGYNPVVPPKKNRKHTWDYDKPDVMVPDSFELIFDALM
jgi:hypothetical protein